MTTILKEFWIFSKDGVPYLNFFRDLISNNQFDARLFNKDTEIAQKVELVLGSNKQDLSSKKILSFEYQDNRYVIFPCLNNFLYLVLKSSLDMKIKKIQNIAKIICSIIMSLYMVMDFRTWKGNIKEFDKLTKKIDLYFKMSDL